MTLIDNRGDTVVSGRLALPGMRARPGRRVAAAGGLLSEIVDLLAVPEAAWVDLADRAAEANAFFHPAWARAVARHAEGHDGSRALLVWDAPARTRLLALLPVVSAWRALKLPLPFLVAWQAYAPLTTPLLDAERIDEAARGLLDAVARAGALAVLLPRLSESGAVAQALRRAAAGRGPAPRIMDLHQRALLDATQAADAALEPLGVKKLKELRRQRNRLGDDGAVSFALTTDPDAAIAGLDAFLSLEASGWKGARGTALAQKPGDAAFVREGVAGMLRAGRAQIATLASGERVVGAGIVLRHLRRGYFFKIAYDETLAKTSPGVQITLDITRALCADPGIDSADSIAVSQHPMIDHVWRARLAVCDLLLPAGAGRSAFLTIATALAARHAAREFARAAVHRLRSLRGVRP